MTRVTERQTQFCSRLCYNERKGRYYLNSSEPVKTFYGLRLDMKKLSLASYFSEIISYTVTEGQSARDIYRLFMNCLYMLSEKDVSCEFVKFIFEMRITADLGLMPGTLSGAPKIRAMEIIDELETVRRGLYGGATGYVGFNGNIDMCITIRTMIKKGSKVYLQAGAGIVADSVGELEYQECCNKVMALAKTLVEEENL